MSINLFSMTLNFKIEQNVKDSTKNYNFLVIKNVNKFLSFIPAEILFKFSNKKWAG